MTEVPCACVYCLRAGTLAVKAQLSPSEQSLQALQELERPTNKPDGGLNQTAASERDKNGGGGGVPFSVSFFSHFKLVGGNRLGTMWSEHFTHRALSLHTPETHTFNPRTLHTFTEIEQLLWTLSLSYSIPLSHSRSGFRGGLLCLHRAHCIVGHININTNMLQRRQSLCRTDVGGNGHTKISEYKAQLRTWNLIFAQETGLLSFFFLIFICQFLQD